METALLIDNENLAHRAFFATFKHEKKPKGFPVSAINTWAGMVHGLLREFRPSKVIFAFDHQSFFRKQLYPGYKAQRPEKPDDLKLQLLFIRRITKRIGLPYAEDASHEADDLIGSLAYTLSPKYHCFIASTDKDLGQLVGPNVQQVKPERDKLWSVFGPDEVAEHIGVSPDQIPMFLALTGDTVDNIPGIDGIGEKTAVKILRDKPGFDEIVHRVCETRKLPEGVVRGALALNLQLTTVRQDIPVTLTRRENDSIEKELTEIGALNALRTLEIIMREERFKNDPLPDETI